MGALANIGLEQGHVTADALEDWAKHGGLSELLQPISSSLCPPSFGLPSILNWFEVKSIIKLPLSTLCCTICL